MRERLIAAFVGLTVAIITLYGVPRAYIVAEQVQLNEERKVERSLELLGALLTERLENSAPITEEYLTGFLNEAERIEYVSSDGSVAVATESSWPTGENDIQRTQSLHEAGSVTLSRSAEFIRGRVVDAVFPVIATGLGLVLASMLLGFWLARRLSRPFRQLARVAGELGSGRFDVEIPRYSVPEADEIAQSLRSSTNSLRELVRREQEFAVNASHQLRTPVTALRLEIEDLAMTPDIPPSVAEGLEAALRELDRLSETVSELLAVARGQRLASAAKVDVGELVRSAVNRWDRAAREQKRSVSLRVPPQRIDVAIPSGPVNQVLDVLIDNALDHGAGTVRIAVKERAAHVEITVSDSGLRPRGVAIFARSVRGESSTGEGIGLSVAQELIAAVGGHLLLADGPSTTFRMLLPTEAHPLGDMVD